jgi:putative oxidoreductase
MRKLEGQSDVALLIGRLFYSSLFLLYGYFKLADYAGTVDYLNSNGVPAPALFAVLTITVELGGGVLMLLGYQTRLVALGLAFGVLVAEEHGDSGWIAGLLCERRGGFVAGWAQVAAAHLEAVCAG